MKKLTWKCQKITGYLKRSRFFSLSKTVICSLFIFFYAAMPGQNLYPSLLDIETTLAKKTVRGQCPSGLLQVNENTGEIALLFDARGIHTGNDTLDSLLTRANKAELYMRGNFPLTNLSFVDNNNEEQREFSGKAQVTLNMITKEINYTCTVFNLMGEDEFSLNNMAYPLRINLYLELDPIDFKLQMHYPLLVNGIKVQISKGIINRLNAGGRSLFSKY